VQRLFCLFVASYDCFSGPEKKSRKSLGTFQETRGNNSPASFSRHLGCVGAGILRDTSTSYQLSEVTRYCPSRGQIPHTRRNSRCRGVSLNEISMLTGKLGRFDCPGKHLAMHFRGLVGGVAGAARTIGSICQPIGSVCQRLGTKPQWMCAIKLNCLKRKANLKNPGLTIRISRLSLAKFSN
jgi:hypothetical protein